MRGIGWIVGLSLLVACGGGEEDDGSVAGDVPGIGAAGAGAAGIPAGSACSAGERMPCTCVDGAQGTQSCQLDGTFSVCQCTGAAPAAAGDPSVPAPTDAAPPGGEPAAPGEPSEPVMQAPADPSGVVMVPPEDVEACNGMGTPPTADENVEVLEIRTGDVVPGGFTSPAGTFYGCYWIEIDMPEKHHIIGWEGAVGGDRTIHHQQVSLNPPPFYLPAQGQGGLCGLPTVEYTWTGERPPEWTPGIAGYPIGGPENGGKAHFLWQVHFEGATTYSGGFNAYITKNLRKYDAGNFEQGDVAGILIPAGQAATHVATCTPEETAQKLVHPIYVYSSMLHAHLTVQRIFAEHYRDGQLINTFGDETASFGFFDQRFQPHTPCIEVLPGDEIVTTCEYNNPFPYDVTGGEATNQEMCTVFMQYFPRLPGNSNNFCGTIDATGGFMP